MASRFERELRSAHRPQSLADLGSARPRIAAGHWRRTSRGFYAPASALPLSSAQRILDVAPLVPEHGAISGWAAAYVHGADMLDGLDLDLRPMPVIITTGTDLGRRGTAVARFVRDRLDPSEVVELFDLSVTSPIRTLVDGARRARNLTEAVVFLDTAMHSLGITVAEVASTLPDWDGRPGLAQFRTALRWAEPASASPWESRLRVFYCLTAGLPRPRVNPPVFDLEERFLGIPDLLDEEAGLVTEFDGQDHRQRRQHRDDNLREEKLEAANLVVCRVDSLDMRYPMPLRNRLVNRRNQGLARDRSKDAWTLRKPAWWLRKHRA